MKWSWGQVECNFDNPAWKLLAKFSIFMLNMLKWQAKVFLEFFKNKLFFWTLGRLFRQHCQNSSVKRPEIFCSMHERESKNLLFQKYTTFSSKRSSRWKNISLIPRHNSFCPKNLRSLSSSWERIRIIWFQKNNKSTPWHAEGSFDNPVRKFVSKCKNNACSKFKKFIKYSLR